MADTTALKNRIRAAVKANDNQEITGPVLQQALLDMVDELNGATETEAQQRQSGDSTLQQGINAEAQQRQSGDSTLQQGINTERQARIDADNTLDQEIQQTQKALILDLLLDKSAYAVGGTAYSGEWNHHALKSDGTIDESQTFSALYVSDFYKNNSDKDFAFVRLNGLNTLNSGVDIVNQQPPIVNICLYDKNKNFVKCYNAFGSAIIGVPRGYYLRTWHDSVACSIEDFIKTDVTLHPTENLINVATNLVNAEAQQRQSGDNTTYAKAKKLWLDDSDFTNVLTGVVDYYATDTIDLTKEYYLKICGYRENRKSQTIIQVYDGNNTLVEQVTWNATENKVYEIKCAGFVFLIDSQFLPQNAAEAFIGYNLHLNKFPRKDTSLMNAIRLNELLDKSAYATDGADYSGTWSHGLLQSDGTEDTSRSFPQLYISDFYKCTSTKDFAFVRLNGLNTLASVADIAKQQPDIVNICLYDQNKNFIKCYNAFGSAVIGVPRGYYLRTWHDSTVCAVEDFIKTDVTLNPTEKILEVVESYKSASNEKFSIIIPFFESNKEILKDVINYFVGNDGNLVYWSTLKYAIFDVTGLSEIRIHVGENGYVGAPIWTTFSQLVDGDVAAAYKVRNHIGTQAEQHLPYDETIQLQNNENYIAINYNSGTTCSVSYIENPDTTLTQLEGRVKNLEDEVNGKNKLMKVVIGNNGAFRIRTKYNTQKDIIITHCINGNSCLSFQYAYIGAKSLSDEELMVSNNRVSNNADSTAPLYNVSEYWFIFGNHGYLIPTISNSVGMTSSDIGAIWKDQNNNRYTIGKVTDTTIYLLPYIYQDAQGHYHREWNGTLTTLTHVSGGVYTNTVSVVGYDTTQTYPLMNSQNRKFFADGIEVSVGDIVYCDNFTAQEEQLGYDPATINWFGGTGGETDLTNAEIMAKLLFSFNYHGAMCCLNTTFDLKREVLFSAYGALQQEFPSDNGSYQAMVMIPKVAAHDGIEIDKPFHSVSESSTIDIYRTAQHLKDVDDLPDRMICYLQNPNNNEYLVGMAAGFSLVSGDTINAKRLQNMPQGDSNLNYLVTRLGRNYANKFYNFAFNSAPYAADSYYIPTTFFKQVNCYVCYFDPAENVGQVYWYKDGNKYLIYAHCQQVENKLSISLPDEMNGLSISIVEKTDDAELLTDVIQNGELLVNFNSADANYLVLCAQ